MNQQKQGYIVSFPIPGAAKAAGISPSMVKLALKGEVKDKPILKSVRVGRRRLILVSDLEEWLRAGPGDGECREEANCLRIRTKPAAARKSLDAARPLEAKEQTEEEDEESRRQP